MNALVTSTTPDRFSRFAALAEKATTNIHSIGIKASRWRLRDPQDEELVVPDTFLDVIMVDANPNTSKMYYAGPYDPNKEGTGPDCWSDNGITPATSTQSRQAESCAQCPHNVRGSKVTPTGALTKACADSVKLAVVLAANPAGAVYLLRVPAASLKNMYGYIEAAVNRKIDVSEFITRLEFDPEADFPKIKFSAKEDPNHVEGRHLNAEQIKAVAAVSNTPELQTVIGLKDVAPQQSQPVALPAPTPAPAAIEVLNPIFANPPSQAPAQTPKPRGRKAKIEFPTAAPPAPIAPPTPAASSGFFDRINSAAKSAPPTPAAQVQVNPRTTTEDLDAMLTRALSV